MATSLTDQVVQTLKSAARKLTGFRRRQFLAEVALEYCDGSARQAERRFGWGRQAVQTGLHERRTGLRCLDDFGSRGRKKTEELHPGLAAEVERLVEPHAQADPKFQTPFAYTRVTARAVREQLLQNEELRDVVPCRQTVGEILDRMGYRLRRVVKTLPQKKSPRPTPSSPTCTPAAPRRGTTRDV